MMFSGKTVCVLICAMNEAQSLPKVISSIPTWVDEVIVIDGHSTDRTREVAKMMCPRSKVFVQPGRGKGNALQYGMLQSTSEIMVTIDADGQTDPKEITSFLNPLVAGADFAKGTRLKYGRPGSMEFHKLIGNKILVLAANILFNAKYTDMAAGLRAYYLAKVKSLKLVDGGEADQELYVKILKMRLRVVEVPYTHLPRISGKSRFHDFPQGFKNLSAIFRARFDP